MELEPIAQMLATKRTVAFRHGLADREPVARPGDWRGVGVTDLSRRATTRVVQVGLPAKTMATVAGGPSGNPLNRIGRGFMKRLLAKTAGTPNEIRFDGPRCTLRSAPDGEWRDVSIPGADAARRRTNDPAWVLDLVNVHEAAVRACAEVERGDQILIDAKLDAAAAEGLLPEDLATSATDPGAADHFDEIAVQVLYGPGHVPTQVAASWGSSNLTHELQWNVVELTGFDVEFDAVDLWGEWTSLSGTAEETATR